MNSTVNNEFKGTRLPRPKNVRNGRYFRMYIIIFTDNDDGIFYLKNKRD